MHGPEPSLEKMREEEQDCPMRDAQRVPARKTDRWQEWKGLEGLEAV